MYKLDFELGVQPSCSNTRHLLCETTGKLVICYVCWVSQVLTIDWIHRRIDGYFPLNVMSPLLLVSIAYTPCSVDREKGESAAEVLSHFPCRFFR
jgi:hypothetical protein